MVVLSKFTSKQAAVAASGFAAVLYMMYRKKAQAAALRRNQSAPVLSSLDKSAQKSAEKAHVDADFFRRLWHIFKVILPSAFCHESAYMILVAAALMSRTFADIWMIQNGTAIESAIIGRDITLFKHHLVKFIYAMPAISVVNNMLKYGLNELKLRFRTRLSQYLYSQYMNGFTFYKMSNLDNRIANADQILTQDVEKFCDSVVELYSNVSKPILDIFLYVHRLTHTIGFQGPAWMLFYLFCSGLVLTRLRRPLGKLTVQEQQLEGEFRHINSRVITNSEEIAFYQGNTRERTTIFRSLDRLVDHLRRLVLFKFSMGFLDNIVAKYIATLVGYTVVSRPFFNLGNPGMAKHTQKDLLEDYYKSGRMLVRLAEAIGRLALAGRELTRLAGFTSRLTTFMQVLKELNQGKYVRTMVTTQSHSGSSADLKLSQNRLIPGSGIIIKKDHIIKFENVPLVTPNGDLLVPNLNFEVKSGMNVLVCGPNGCGKSSLFRTLGELWPLFGGTVTKPDKSKLFYIPQRPYMTLGTLRDQIIYPHTHSDMIANGSADRQLEEYLELVQLSYILEREGGWDSRQDWMDVLSGGEKQRIAMARLFYHRPQFAILDECTSAVSVDVEGRMYSYCREVGISLFTVSHRKSLWNHHEFYLKFDGQGNYEFERIDENTSQFGS